jgi:hypothetical protein
MRALWVACAAIVAAGGVDAAEKKINFTGCVRQGKACLLIANTDGKLAYALVRDLKGKIEPGKAYRISGTLSNATPCDNAAGSLDPKKAEAVTLECREPDAPPPSSTPR